MSAATYNITIEQGTDYNLFFTWKEAVDIAIDITDYTAIDITGYTAAMQIRLAKTAVGTLVSLSSPTSITLGDAAGTVSVDMNAAITGALTFKDAVYDLELTDGSGKVTRLLEGSVTLSKQVTR